MRGINTNTESTQTIQKSTKKALCNKFINNSDKLGNEAIVVEKNMFIEAAEKENVEFEMVRLSSFEIKTVSLDVSNASNAIIEADYACSKTGKLVVDSSDPDVYLTIFLAQNLHIVIPKSKIVNSLEKGINGVELMDLGRGILCRESDNSVEEVPYNCRINNTTIYIIEDL
ncbi:MAG: LUD domain-containing protein [Marinifilaceae bacterium]|jgi:L-lactate utilization protein LutC|nr:LUD domain-containing protein [Marinifilaceae bacterium]